MKNKLKQIIIALVFVTLVFSLNAEDDSVLMSYRRNFIRANINTKAQLVTDALKITGVDMNPFFMDVLEYADDASGLLYDDPILTQIATSAINKLTENNYSTASFNIQFIFSKLSEDSVQIACLKAFEKFNQNDESLIETLNKNYETLFLDMLDGRGVSKDLLLQYIKTLGSIGNSRSFSILFDSLVKLKDTTVKNEIKAVLISKYNNFFAEIVSIIEKNNIYYIQTAFELAKSNQALSKNLLGQIAEEVLLAGLDNLSVYPEVAQEVISDCLLVIKELRWTDASELVVDYFYKMQADYVQGKATADDLIQIVSCMGVMSSKECADSLAVFLGLLNSRVESGSRYDKTLVLTVINALGELGHKTAFEYLLFVGFVDNYTEEIKQAATNAIARLKW